MSCSTLYEVRKSGVKEISEYRNSWHSAMSLWTYMAQEFCGMESFPLFTGGQKVWDCYKRPDVPINFRAAMALTLDYIIVPIDRTKEFGKMLKGVHESITAKGMGSHWEKIATDIAEYKPKRKGAIGLALNASSVNDIWICKAISKLDMASAFDLVEEASDGPTA
jgi:hypothetical protein